MNKIIFKYNILRNYYYQQFLYYMRTLPKILVLIGPIIRYFSIDLKIKIESGL